MCFININITNRNGTLEDNALVSQTFWVALDILLLIVIVSGNTLTMCAMHKCRRLYSLISNKFVASLAVSDLLVGLTIPYHTAFYLNDTLCKNKTLCLSRFVLIVLGCCASICNLISIALDRYIAILYPFHYCRLMTQRMVSGMIVGGWITAIIIATIPTYWNDWDIAIMCEIDEVLTDNYILMVLTPSFLSVWVALLIVYWRIWREASEHVKRIRIACHLAAGHSDWKSVQVVLMVMGSFSVCWLPFIAISCARVLGLRTEESSLVYKIAFSLAMANSCMNPIIYAWKNSDFKEQFIQLVCCQPHHPNTVQSHISLKIMENSDIQTYNTAP